MAVHWVSIASPRKSSRRRSDSRWWPDAAPNISVLAPRAGILCSQSPSGSPSFSRPSDDYGLDHLALVVYRVTAFGDRMAPVEQPMPVGGTRGALLRPVIDLTSWELLPGDTIRYFARAVDNAPIPNVSETREYVLRPPTTADLRREAQERLDDAARGVEQLANPRAFPSPISAGRTIGAVIGRASLCRCAVSGVRKLFHSRRMEKAIRPSIGDA